MIVLVGQSAAGKDTLLQKILETDNRFSKVVTYTSRPMRKDEVEGDSYHFITKEAFEKLLEKQFFVCVSHINGWYYGIPYGELVNSENKITILNPAGMREIKQRMPDSTVIYLNVNDRIRLIRQILRGDDLNEVVRRFTFDAGQFLGVENESDFIINDDVYEPDIKKSTEGYLDIFNQILDKIAGNESESEDE